MRRRLVALSALAAAIFPRTASAQTREPWTAGVGVFGAYAFGSKQGFEWGVEGLATYRFSGLGCSSYGRSGLGPLVQLAFIDLERPRLTLAAQGGGELQRGSSAFTGELGATARFGEHAGMGVHTGLTFESVLLNLFGRHQWLLDSSAVGGGVRFWPTYGPPGSCAVGRPLRTEHGVAPTCPTRRRGNLLRKQAAHVNASTREAARGWEQDAHYECASVPAFLQLAADLLLHGAPDALVERALASAEDEMRHAALCARLASRYAGEEIWPGLPDVKPRPALPGVAGLQRLAQESWLDGCLSEGAAASRAKRAASLALDPLAKSVQISIAADEARHAKLGWSVLSWAAERGGDEVCDALRTLRNAELQQDDTDESAFSNYGRIGARAANDILERHLSDSRGRFDRLKLIAGSERTSVPAMY